MKISFLLLILIVFCTFGLKAQKGDPDLALQYFTLNDYESALDEYLLLLSEDSTDEKFNYRVAVCYLNTNIQKAKAIQYLKKVIQLNSKYNANAHFLLGKAHHFNQEFDIAIEQYNKYKNMGGGTAATPQEVEREMEYCYNAREMIKFPVHVSFENLGKQVNSLDQDYFPFLPVDESYVLFNSKRPISKNIPSDRTSSIWMSNVKKGKFLEAFSIPKIISSKNFSEEIVGLSSSGDIGLFYVNEEEKKGDLYIGTRSDSGFKNIRKLNEAINSTSGHEIAGTLLNEGDVIYFASDRKGGLGGTDLYASKKLPNGQWGPAFNLGSSVNTTLDEDFPNISPDGKTLYFSSKGHTSMGGYDIFTSTLDVEKNTFEKPRNIGYPINTVYDDMNFRLSQTGRYGYLSSLRPNGIGDYDLYRVTFEDLEPENSIIKGYLKTSTNEPIEEVIIDITDHNTGELFGTYQPNFNNMRYIIILPPGVYDLYVEVPGFKKIQETIEVYGKSSFIPELSKDIVLDLED